MSRADGGGRRQGVRGGRSKASLFYLCVTVAERVAGATLASLYVTRALNLKVTTVLFISQFIFILFLIRSFISLLEKIYGNKISPSKEMFIKIVTGSWYINFYYKLKQHSLDYFVTYLFVGLKFNDFLKQINLSCVICELSARSA